MEREDSSFNEEVSQNMKPLLPGQAGFTRLDGLISLVAFDHKENLRLGGASFEVRSGMYTVLIEGVDVPATNLILKLSTEEGDAYYVAWIDELTPDGAGVVESLATQTELPVVLATPLGERLGRAVTENGLRALSNKQLGIISELAERTRWNVHHFAAARSYIESQYSTPAALWTMLGGE
jgi:hypothetical protein